MTFKTSLAGVGMFFILVLCGVSSSADEIGDAVAANDVAKIEKTLKNDPKSLP